LSPIAFDGDGKLTGEERIPPDVLESYFGKDVHRVLNVIRKERAKRKQGEESELMDLLISRNWFDRFAEFTNVPV